jgi:hypothetical protein
MTVITQKEIKEINRLYLQLKTYAAVSRATGFSPATVKKYIIKDYSEPDESKFIRFDKPLPEFDSSIFQGDDWGALCVLSPEEEKEIIELWKELDV